MSTDKRILITGANGHLGRRLLAELGDPASLRALVRSARAAAQVRAACPAVEVVVADYGDAAAMAAGVAGCTHVVHLVGIIRESPGNSFAAAHEDATRSLLAACTGSPVRRILHLSLTGADPASDNACLASRGRTERLLLDSGIDCLIIRLPMVLGEGDIASAALGRHCRRGLCLQFRATSLDQPIYAGDVVAAVRAGLDARCSGILELAGPECVTRRELIRRAARIRGTHSRVLSVPIGLGYLAADLLERLLPSPPLSRAMLGVLDHDDRVDTAPACRALGLQLTPLDETLRCCLGEPER